MGNPFHVLEVQGHHRWDRKDHSKPNRHQRKGIMSLLPIAPNHAGYHIVAGLAGSLPRRIARGTECEGNTSDNFTLALLVALIKGGCLLTRYGRRVSILRSERVLGDT